MINLKNKQELNEIKDDAMVELKNAIKKIKKVKFTIDMEVIDDAQHEQYETIKNWLVAIERKVNELNDLKKFMDKFEIEEIKDDEKVEMVH